MSLPVAAQPVDESAIRDPVLARTASAGSVESSDSAPSQARLDREWLTAYMMCENGYRLDHLAALDDAFDKMTPSQLRIFRQLSEEKHRMETKRNALDRREQSLQLAIAELRHARQKMAPGKISGGQWQAATLAEQRLHELHRQAATARQRTARSLAPFPTSPASHSYGDPLFPVPAYFPRIPVDGVR